MSYTDRNEFSNQSGSSEAEETLRLVARLPAPAGLEDRVRAGLRSAPHSARVLAWPSPISPIGGWLRAAAAAAIVVVIAGGGWGIYSRVQPGQPVGGAVVPHVGVPGGFSEGGAVRRPQTLVGPVVAPPPAVQKPKAPATGAGKAGTAPSGKAVPEKKAAAPTVAK